MDNIVQKIQDVENVVCTSKPPPNDDAHDSNIEGTAIEISSAPIFGLDYDNLEDIQ